MIRMIFAAFLAALAAGCTSSVKYTEGTATSLGTYVPYDGSVYGLEIVQYLSGCKVCAPSGAVLTVSRTFAASNTYFGIVHTSEASTTTVGVR